MKKIIKIVAILITLIIVNYNMCFADLIDEPRIFGHGNLLDIIAFVLPLIFILGIILIIIEIVTYIYKNIKTEETHKIKDIINKTVISIALLGSFYILLYLFFYGGIFWGILLLMGSIISIIARKKKRIKLSNIICGIIILLSIINFPFFIIDNMLFSQTNDTRRSSYTTIQLKIHAI